MDFYLPLFDGTTWLGTLTASYDLNKLLEGTTPWWFAQEHQISLSDSDDHLLAQRAALGPGRGVYTHSRVMEFPGQTLILHTNSLKGAPSLVPKLLAGSVIVLALGLMLSLWTLWRHVARRLAAESALRQQMSFRTAMENSLVTGMRARDLAGRVTYVNPAFCQIVGYEEHELLGKLPPMPYWAPEAMIDYQERFAQVLAGTITPQGFETIFQRADGTRIPVLIFESPLLDEAGKHTGWMGSILDISDRKRVEELNRQQQEKLQTSARLATMGEISSMLAHELNQPLAAISSYTTGALNLLQQPQAPDTKLLQAALEKASTQAQRAGQIIRSVHEFVKKREPTRLPVAVQEIVDTILPLVELQAQRYFVKVETEVAQGLPQLLADKTMLEQVLLNLTRNAIEAMRDVPPARRVLRLRAQPDIGSEPPSLTFAVIDQGHGIAPDVAARLFSPFFSTKAEGMGMGLNICRTAIEFHGGVLQHENHAAGGTIFKFSLPVLTQAD
ncbi:MAG: PAS domain S-box protein, partial [Burkholderiales bacterium]|nr:PAS domain S-box protein [Burkholderiales bacterium]